MKLPEVMGVDWVTLIRDLMGEFAMTRRQVAVAVGIHEQSVRFYLEGTKKPRHYTGERLIVLWMEITGCGRDLLPVDRYESTR